jgi:hypothetical protein
MQINQQTNHVVRDGGVPQTRLPFTTTTTTSGSPSTTTAKKTAHARTTMASQSRDPEGGGAVEKSQVPGEVPALLSFSSTSTAITARASSDARAVLLRSTQACQQLRQQRQPPWRQHQCHCITPPSESPSRTPPPRQLTCA